MSTKMWPFTKQSSPSSSPPQCHTPVHAHERQRPGESRTLHPPGSNSAYDDGSARSHSHYSHTPRLRRQLSYDEDVDERTRLLAPRQAPRLGRLDPDDPAVSPYNLWTVGPTFLLIVGLYITLLNFFPFLIYLLETT